MLPWTRKNENEEWSLSYPDIFHEVNFIVVEFWSELNVLRMSAVIFIIQLTCVMAVGLIVERSTATFSGAHEETKSLR